MPTGTVNEILQDANSQQTRRLTRKTFNFPTDLQGLSTLVSQSVTLAHSSDGPAVGDGSMEWDVDPNAPIGAFTVFGEAGTPTVGVTWESWGVPPGERVTYLQMAGTQARVVDATGLDAVDGHVFAASAINPTFVPLYTDDNGATGGISALLPTVADGWQAQPSAPLEYVADVGAPSTSPIRLLVTYGSSVQSNPSPIVVRLSAIEADITSTAALGGTTGSNLVPTLSLVHVGPNFMRYLMVAGASGTASITTTGAASPDLLTDSVQGPLRKAAKAFTDGYGKLAPGPLTQAKARVIWLGDDPANLAGNALIQRMRMYATPRAGSVSVVMIDANVDGGGHPILTVTGTAIGVWSAYVDIICPGAIGD